MPDPKLLAAGVAVLGVAGYAANRRTACLADLNALEQTTFDRPCAETVTVMQCGSQLAGRYVARNHCERAFLEDRGWEPLY